MVSYKINVQFSNSAKWKKIKLYTNFATKMGGFGKKMLHEFALCSQFLIPKLSVHEYNANATVRNSVYR